MRTITVKTFLGLIIILSFLALSTANAERPKNTSDNKVQSLLKPTGLPLHAMLNINNFTTWYRADGESSDPSSGALDGGVFPRGTKWVIYQDGIVWGGKAYLDAAHTQEAPLQLVRIGGQTYNVGTVEGRIVGMDSLAVAVSRSGADVRIYRIRRDYKVISADELKLDAAGVNEILVGDVTTAQMEAVTSQYQTDWNEWPVQYGAPYIERNGTPGYQKPPAFNYDEANGHLFTVDSLIAGNYDEPGLAGSDPNSPADQVIWTVYNDLNETATLGLYGSEPIGLEVQATLWGYKRTDAMGNLYFKKIKIINKGGAVVDYGDPQVSGDEKKGSFYIDSMYIAQWSDPDLGAFGDDLAGCDSVLSLGFVYNGNASDAEFTKFNLPPPAAGYDFLQGPLVAGAPSDTGIFDLKKVGGKKNLGMSSYAYFAASSAISDPEFNYEGGLRWWKMLRGFVPDDSSPEKYYDHPPGYPISKFPLSGDPVARTGFLDGKGENYSFAPGDRRIVLNTGPFTLAPADTQEIVVGTVGGIGADRLSSVAVMKYNDRFVQNTYNALFQVPKPPATPDVQIAELDGKIVLEWGSNLKRVTQTENIINEPGTYKFEGYNVYQLPSRSSSLSSAKRLMTFDLPTDPTVVLDIQLDPATSTLLSLPVQYGTNSGIKRYFEFTRDYVLDVDKLSNGQEYYLAVTAYTVASQSGYLPAALESPPTVYTVRPHKPAPGDIINADVGATVPSSKVNSTPAGNDGSTIITVVDPTAVTGHTYKITFATVSGKKVWNVVDSTANKVVLSNQLLYGDDASAPIVDGLQIKVLDPGVAGGIKSVVATKIGSEVQSPAYDILRTASPDENWTIDAAGATSRASARTRLNWRSAAGSYDYEVRVVAGASGSEYYIGNGSLNDNPKGAGRIPLQFWNVTTNIQLTPKILDDDEDATYNTSSGLSDQTESGLAWERIYVTTVPAYSEPLPATSGTNAGPEQPLGRFIIVPLKEDNFFPPEGTIIKIITNKPILLADQFVFTTSGLQPTIGNVASAKAAIQKMTVFPNPYYAYNAAEVSRFQRFVTFNNLPPTATIRIFNLAGQLVRTIEKDPATNSSTFQRWDLLNRYNFPVASGIYIAHIEAILPDGSKVTKILKIAIIQEQEVPEVF